MDERSEQRVKYPLRLKLILVAAVIIVPMLILSVYQITALRNYSSAYDMIVRRITAANNYNLNFKEEMDESMYKIVAQAETFETIDANLDLVNPQELIAAARLNFSQLQKITTGRESLSWLKRILLNLNTLEDRINEIRGNLQEAGYYEKNMAMLESDIYILTELFQEEVQNYIYYETQNFEAIRQSMDEQVSKVILTMFIALASIIVASLLMNVLLTDSITKPIKMLCDKTALVAKGDFQSRMHCTNHDELSVLSDSFNDMAVKLEQQVNRIVLEQENLRNMESKLLQAQINPHFLYNTLDTIIWLIEGGKNKEAIQMVVALSDFFRVAVSKGKDVISVRDEVMHIRSYLQIQQSRYYDILDYEIQVEEELFDFPMIKLTLQPIVENALYHGIKMLRAKGKILITGEKVGEELLFQVKDNGIGMDEKELQALRDEVKRPLSDLNSGFGLANVNKRIKLNYGEAYGLEIESKKGEGTLVRVRIPVGKMQEEEAKVL